MQRYQVGDIIGSGASGLVRKSIDRRTYKTVAIKQIDMSDMVIPKEIIREIFFLTQLKHPNIMSSEVVLVSAQEIWVVMDYLPMNLERRWKMDDDPNAYKNYTKRYLKQLLEGVDYCHARGVVHRDLKPANILIDTASDTIKIADFGLARAINSTRPLTPKCGTLYYRAPEVLLEESEYTSAVDMWAVGCIFAELVNKRILLKAETSWEMVLELYRTFGTLTEETWPGIEELGGHVSNFDVQPAKDLATVVPGLNEDGYDLLSGLLCLRPTERLTAAEALKHEYLRDI